MKQPKPMVGQTWHCSANEVDVIAMHFIKNGNMEWSDGENSDLEWTHEFMTFVPQNDLEWLAVNVDKWDCDKPLIRTNGTLKGYNFQSINACPGVNCYTRHQWQNMRYRLGLDTKPHYKLINGQWSETK